MQQVLLEHISRHTEEVVEIGISKQGLTEGKMVLNQPDEIPEPMIECTACIIHLNFSKVST